MIEEGGRVRLLPVDDEGPCMATVIDVGSPSEPVMLVQIDEEYRDSATDDGLREVPVEQVVDASQDTP